MHIVLFANAQGGNLQARTCVFVKALPLGTDVEIEVVAGLDPARAKL